MAVTIVRIIPITLDKKYIYILAIQAFCSLFAAAQGNLQQYIDAAQKNSPLINDNLNQIKASEYDLQRLRAIYTGAQVDLNGNFLFAPVVATDNNKTTLELNSHGATKYYGFELAQTNGGIYQGLITYTQPLFNSARYNTAAEQIDIGRQINRQTIRLTEHDLAKLVTDQYILCLMDEKQMAFTDSMLVLVKQQLDLVKKLAASSLLKQSDVSLLNIEYENNLNILATFKASYHSKLMDLNILCGIKDTADRALPDLDLQLNIAPVAVSGYLEKFRLDSMNLVAAQNVFELKYKPTLNFYSNGGLNAAYVSTALNRFGFSAGLSLNFNLFDGRQRRSTREKTEILKQTVSFYKDNFSIQNEVRKHQFLTNLASYTERRDHLRQQAAEYAQLLTDYKKEILQGEISIINYVTVLKNMVLLKRDYFLAETNSLLLINGYNYWNW